MVCFSQGWPWGASDFASRWEWYWASVVPSIQPLDFLDSAR